MNCQKTFQRNKLIFAQTHERRLRAFGIKKKLTRCGRAELQRRVEALLVGLVNSAQMKAIQQDRRIVYGSDVAGALLGDTENHLLCKIFGP